jgi:CubicO group peptidase (beta-lactamase class C family)
MKTSAWSRARAVLILLAAFPSVPLAFSAADPAPNSSTGIAAVLQPFVDRHELAGAVTLVTNRDKVLSLEGIGFADIAASRPMGPDALFWIASQSKPITAAALMMLVDEGKVRLDDPVGNYLPEFKDAWMVAEQDKDHQRLRKPKHPMTVRHLLNHTSGMPFKSALEEPTLDRLPLAVAVRSYAMTPLHFEPGTRFQYSNAGINTAGRILEVVSGIPYEEFLDRRLFGPLGMKDTTFWPTDEQVARLAKAYRPGPDRMGLEVTTITQLQYPLQDRKRRPMPAGGLFSTAQDVGRFCQMILNNGVFEGRRYLSEAAVAEMTKKQTGDALKEGYGLGWSTGGGSFGHGGAYATNMVIDPKRGLIVVFLVQHAGFPGDGSKAHAAFQQAAMQRFGSGQ